jgi:glycosyltransferase involved in cell wall biosynthesis
MISLVNKSEVKLSCFINPFSNHSYFTVRGLSERSTVLLFCPPLQLQLLFRSWKFNDLRLASPLPSARLYSVLCILAFLLYWLRLFSHSTYLSFFRILLSRYLENINACSLFVYYQDYVSDLVTCHRPEAIRICELILRSDSSQPNYESTISAIQSASIVVIPTTGIINLPSTSNIRSFMAPYGGNKSEFYSHRFSRKKFKCSERFPDSSLRLRPSTIRILARSHSFRKGADVLLHALCLLDNMLKVNAFGFNIEVHICGAIQEPYIYSEYLKATSHLSQSGCIHLHCQQYGRHAFSRLLANSQLFVMPSRLEGSSPAALEALWHGVPSILTPDCGVHDFVHGRHGSLLTSHEPFDLAHAIFAFCADSSLLIHCRRCLKADRPLFGWERYFEAYNQLLSEVCC